MSRIAGITWLVRTIVAAVGACAIAVPVFGHASAASSHVVLVEATACHHPRVSPVPLSVTLTPSQQPVVVRVPATTFLRLDRSGRVTAAATNTGCAPRSTDQIYVARADGTLRRTSSIHVDHYRWTGDFTVAARYQMQRGG